MANPNLVRKPAYDVNGLGEVSPSNILDVGPNDQNYIINGAFDFWQRALTQTVTTEVNGPMDRWSVGRSAGTNGSLTVARTSDAPSNGKSTYSLSATVASASASLAAAERWGIFQKIEGQVAAPLYQEKITLSFWVKSSLTGIYSMWFGTGAANNGYYVSTYTINTPNTWEQKSITVDMSAKVGTWSTDSTIGMYIYFALATGSTFNIATPNVWNSSSSAGLSTSAQPNLMSTVGNTFLISQVILNRGSAASPFIRAGRNTINELALCQRYYESNTFHSFTFNGGGGLVQSSGVFYAVDKRAIPTVSINVTAGTAVNSLQTNFIRGFGLVLSLPGAENAYSTGTYTADAEL